MADCFNINSFADMLEGSNTDVFWKMQALGKLELANLHGKAPEKAMELLHGELCALVKKHHPPVSEGALKKPLDTQHTLMKPLRPGLTFTFRIHFENLSDVELGALLWAVHPLQPDPDRPLYLAHHLGMGKPLGMGSVHLTASLTLTPRHRDGDKGRYEKLFTEADEHGTVGWHLGDSEVENLALGEDLEGENGWDQDPRRTFENYVNRRLVEHQASYRGKQIGEYEGFQALPHTESLLRMMAWPGIRAVPPDDAHNEEADTDGRVQLDRDTDKKYANTRYMQIELERAGGENEYKTDPVLPPAIHEYFELVERRSRAAYAAHPPGPSTGAAS